MRRKNNRETFCKTELEEQETTINIDHFNSTLNLYTCRKPVYERIQKKIGEPTKVYYTQNQISGGYWIIPFKEKKKITSILSRPTLIGQMEAVHNKKSKEAEK